MPASCNGLSGHAFPDQEFGAASAGASSGGGPRPSRPWPTAENTLLNFAPSRLKEGTAASAVSVAIRPYSMDVTARSSATKAPSVRSRHLGGISCGVSMPLSCQKVLNARLNDLGQVETPLSPSVNLPRGGAARPVMDGADEAECCRTAAVRAQADEGRECWRAPSKQRDCTNVRASAPAEAGRRGLRQPQKTRRSVSR